MLIPLLFLLAASVVCVSLSRRLGVGSIVGYLAAGVLIGPSGLRLVRDVADIREISEFGVLMLLFLIGLELRLPRIWLLRRTVFGLGGAQVALTGLVLGGIAYAACGTLPGAVTLGFGMALSSTAIVLPMLAERDLLNRRAGRASFGVLLFQDLASVPLIALVPLLAGRALAPEAVWLGIGKAVLAVAVILLVGRYAVRPLFRLVGGIRTQELFTATALMVVLGAAAATSLAGLPASLGAFAAGVILSESEYRHELQADVEPFEGLLLGFFFVSVGMAADLGLLLARPLVVLGGALGLVAVKAALGHGLGRLAGLPSRAALRFAVALAQGSEFGFVLFGAALAAGALSQPLFGGATLIVALSMLASPVLFSLSERFAVPLLDRAERPAFDSADDAGSAPVIICGFGRFGQIVGRILRMRGIAFNALDADAETVATVRRFGTKVYYGDPSRVDLLRAVGAETATLLVAAMGDPAENQRLVETVRREFPHLQVYARARNRRAAHLLMDQGVEQIVRETFYSSLRLSELVLNGLGLPAQDARNTVQAFRDKDVQTLIDQHAIRDDERALIQTSAQAADELRSLVEADAQR